MVFKKRKLVQEAIIEGSQKVQSQSNPSVQPCSIQYTQPKKEVTSTKQEQSYNQVLEQAQELYEYGSTLKSSQLLERNFKILKNNSQGLEFYGVVLADLGYIKRAIKILKQSVRQEPKVGYKKYMYLAQLIQGEEAIQYCGKGVDILKQEHINMDNGSSILCEALTSLAELMISQSQDLNRDVDSILSILIQAQKTDQASPHPYQTIASMFKELDDFKQAKEKMYLSLQRWLPNFQYLLKTKTPKQQSEKGQVKSNNQQKSDHNSSLNSKHLQNKNEEEQGGKSLTPITQENGDFEESDGIKDEDVQNFPTYEFRFETVKLLLEVDDNYKVVQQVLQTLILEDNSNVEVWYLLALAQYSYGYFLEASETLKHSLTLIKQLQNSDEISQDIVLQLKDLKDALKEAKRDRANNKKKRKKTFKVELPSS